MSNRSKYIFILILLASKLSIAQVNNTNLTKLIALESIINNTQQENNLENTTELDASLEFVSPNEQNYTTKAGSVTTSQDFSAVNIIIKTDGTTVGVTGSGITIDSSNNIYGVNTLNITGISLPKSMANNPSIRFPGVATNTGIYSSAQDTVNITSQNFNLISFGPSGVTITPGKNLSVGGQATFNGQTTFNNRATLNNTTFNGPTNLIGTTNLNGSTTLNGPTTLSGSTIFSDASSITIATGSQIILGAGPASNPVIAFNGDLSTGIYSSDQNNLSITTNGSQQLSVSPDVISIPTGVLIVPIGSQTNPSYTFNGNTGSGIYSPAVGQVAISASGAQAILFATGAITIAANHILTLPAGTGSNPTIKFTGLATNSGIYASSSPDRISIGINGTETVTVSTTGVNFSNTTNLNGVINVNSALAIPCQTIPTYTGTTGAFSLPSYPNYTVFLINNSNTADCYVTCDLTCSTLGREIIFCNNGIYPGNTGRIYIAGTGSSNILGYPGYPTGCALYANPTGSFGTGANGKSSASLICTAANTWLPTSGSILIQTTS